MEKTLHSREIPPCECVCHTDPTAEAAGGQSCCRPGSPRFDYDKQVWIVDGKYVRCGHPEEMNCKCYGREHAGEDAICQTCKGDGIVYDPYHKEDAPCPDCDAQKAESGK